MTTATSRRQPELTRQTAVVIGDGAASCSRPPRRIGARGAGMVLTGRNPGRLERAAAGLPEQTGRVMVTAAGPALRLSLAGLPCMS